MENKTEGAGMQDRECCNDCGGGVCSPEACGEDGCGNCCGEGDCRCPHHGFKSFLIVLFGLTFLLGAFNVFEAEVVNIIWPVIVILYGLKKWLGRMCGCC